jgi:hypothetical protein
MEEPSLSCGSLAGTQTYRFVWLRTFDNPIAVRIFDRGGHYHLEAVILDGAGGYRPGRVSRRVTKQLSQEEWQSVLARLEAVQFWKMPTREDEPFRGKDGAQWIVEALRKGHYHVVDRWSGAEDIESVGKLFLDLAGFTDVGDVY